MFFEFLLEVLSVKDIPLPAPLGDGAGKGLDFFTHRFVQTLFAAEKLVQNSLGLGKGPALVGEIRQVVLPQAVEDQVSEMGDAVFR